MVVEFIGGPLDGDLRAVPVGQPKFEVPFMQSNRIHAAEPDASLSPAISIGVYWRNGSYMHWHGYP